MDQAQVKLRKAEEEDAFFVWNLANDPEVRSGSFSTSVIDWEDHIKWFNKRLKDPSCVFFIALLNNVSVGQVRFDFENGDAVISVGLIREHRGKGSGSALIVSSTKELFNFSKAIRVHAYVKVDNKASLLAFERAGYSNLGLVEIKSNTAYHLMKERESGNV